jgi:hypothetical protein
MRYLKDSYPAHHALNFLCTLQNSSLTFFLTFLYYLEAAGRIELPLVRSYPRSPQHNGDM